MENVINFNFISKSKLNSIRKVLQVASILLLFSMLVFASVTNYSVVFLIFSILILQVCVFLDIEDVFCLYIMLTPFNVVFNAGVYSSIYAVFIALIFLILLAKYVYRILHKEIKCSYLVFALMAVYFIYCCLPIFGKNISTQIFTIFLNLLYTFLIYENRDKISLKKFTFCFCASLMLSGLLSFFLKYLDVAIALKNSGEIPNRDNIPKLKGFYAHPNIYSEVIIFSLSLLFYLKYHKKILPATFYCLFAPLFVLGYLTVSRAFIIEIIVLVVIYFIFEIIRDKKIPYKELALIFAIIIAVVLILFKITGFYIMRFRDKYEFELLPFEQIPKDTTALILDCKQKYDAGRLNLYKLYIYFFIHNPVQLFFGRGCGSPYLGQTHSHNFLIDAVYLNGLVGVILYSLIIFKIFNLKKMKQYLNLKRLSFLIILVSFCALQFLNTYFSPLFLTFLIIAFYDKSIFEDISETKYQTTLNELQEEKA